MNNPIRKIDDVIRIITRDTYFLKRDEIDSFEYQLTKIQTQLKELYAKRGRVLI